MSDAAHVSMLRMDQRRRWQQGDRLAVEAYLEREPTLKDDAEAVLELIYNEVVLREEAGEPPRLEEYQERFPLYADQLRVQFEVHQALEGASVTSGNFMAVEEEATAQGRSSEKPLVPGTQLPGYEILEELGRGGMGIVYRARQLALQRVVALKVLLSGAHAGPKERAAFRTEAEAAARLHHPNIVQVYDIAEHDGLPYFSFEFVDGQNLEQKAAGRPLPPGQAAALVETLARAMHHAHQQGIVHRDLKPSNILLAELTPKITDFGVAKLLDAERGQTATGDFLGTPHYMAPEQASGHSKESGPAADVYSLGAILYQLLTGRPPFQGASALEILEQVRFREAAPPSKVERYLPRDLDTICLKCLEKDPRRRYASAQDLAEDLRRFSAGEPILARPAASWERAWKWARRRPAVAGLIGVSTAAILALLLLSFWHQARIQAAHLRYQSFVERRDDALFHGVHGTSFLDVDMAENLKATRTAVDQALATIGLSVDAAQPPVPDRYLSDRENREISDGCYQLLLVLAETIAHRQPGQSQDAYHQQVHLALGVLEQATGLVPPTRAYHLRRARYLAALGDSTAAQQERDRATIEASTAIDFFLLGDEQFREGKFAEAIVSFHGALDKQSDHFWSRFFLACAYLERGLPSDLDETERNLTKCIAQRPRFPWAYLVRSLVHERRKKFAAAEADYGLVLALGAREGARYALFVNRGRMRLGHGELEKAAGDLKEAIALNRASFHPYLILARVLQKEKKLDASNQQLDEAVRRRPPPEFLAQCHLERARNLYLDGNYAGAVKACDEALKALPASADTHLMRAKALLKLAQYEDAVQSLARYEQNGGKPGTDFYRARGQARLHLRDAVGAMADFTSVLEKDADTKIYRHRGWACFFAEAYKAGLADFDEAIRRTPGDADSHIGRGLCRVMLGSYRGASVDADDALRLTPDRPEMMHNIACIFAQAVAKVNGDSKAGDRPELSVVYRDRAVAALRQALAMVAPDRRARFWGEKVFPDTALDPIRNTSEFRQLAKDYGARDSPK